MNLPGTHLADADRKTHGVRFIVEFRHHALKRLGRKRGCVRTDFTGEFIEGDRQLEPLGLRLASAPLLQPVDGTVEKLRLVHAGASGERRQHGLIGLPNY